jgi:hypothetical protein
VQQRAAREDQQLPHLACLSSWVHREGRGNRDQNCCAQ